MEKRTVFDIDDTIENQDWIKARSFDFPGHSRESLEAAFGLTGLTGNNRNARLLQISKWPTMRNAPDWLKEEMENLTNKQKKR